MSIVTAKFPAVQIPTDSEGYLRPDLIPISAYLYSTGYSDRARSRVLNRLADGVSPRECCKDRALAWRDLLEVEALMPVGREAIAPIAGGSPVLDFEPATIAEALAAYDAGDDLGDDLGDDGQAPDNTMSFDAWIDSQADGIRALGTDAADWLAGQIAALADRARFLNASTPAEYDERAEILESVAL